MADQRMSQNEFAAYIAPENQDRLFAIWCTPIGCPERT